MKKTLREYFLSTLNSEDKKLIADNDSFLEWFNEWLTGLDCVEEGSPDHRRWYYTKSVVLKVVIDYEERFFKTYFVGCTGDTELDWEDFYVSPEDCEELYPKEVTTITYVPREEL